MSIKTQLKGKVHKFGDDITSDYIFAGKHRAKAENVLDLKDYVFNEIRPGFSKTVVQGDILVAGENFGMGSSREHAATLIKALGIEVILAKSFARIFYRNCINIGLPVIECDTDSLSEGDILTVNLKQGIVHNATSDRCLNFKPVPESLWGILECGGLVNYFKKVKKVKSGKKAEAIALFNQGFSCSQSVLAAFASDYNLDKTIALRISGGFGGGMGNLGETCGAVSGAFMVIGLKYGKVTSDDKTSKGRTYQFVQEFNKKFTDRYGTINCKELLGCDLNTEEGKRTAREKDLFKTICPGFVEAAIDILEDILRDK